MSTHSEKDFEPSLLLQTAIWNCYVAFLSLSEQFHLAAEMKITPNATIASCCFHFLFCVPCSWQGPSQDTQDICATYQLLVCSVMNHKVNNGYTHTRITCTVRPQKTFTFTKTNHLHPQKSHLVESIFLTAIETSLTSVESPWDDLLGHSVTQLLDMGSETSVTHTCWHINIVLLTCTQ